MDENETFYTKYIDKIYTFCLYRTGNRFVAEDLTSETFLKFFKAASQNKLHVILKNDAAQGVVAQKKVEGFFGTHPIQKWQKFSNPVAYLYTICRNTIIDYYRQNKESVSLEKLIEQGNEPGATFEAENRLLIIEALQEIDHLPPEQKEVLLFQYIQGLDNKTIAEIMKKSESAVKSLAHRGLMTLRKKLNI